MGTFIWLVFTTIVGGVVGHHFFAAMGIGSIIGFLIGVIFRLSIEDGVESIFDCFN